MLPPPRDIGAGIGLAPGEGMGAHICCPRPENAWDRHWSDASPSLDPHVMFSLSLCLHVPLATPSLAFRLIPCLFLWSSSFFSHVW